MAPNLHQLLLDRLQQQDVDINMAPVLLLAFTEIMQHHMAEVQLSR